jgi:phosphoribosylformylglycinamidine synthase
MPSPSVCVLRAPGTNCDVETAYAFEACGGTAERVHLYRLLEDPARLKQYQILCIPGGFSYGDDIGSGVIFSRHLRGRLGEALGEFLQRDTLILGICNGFQVLLKAGILPGGQWPPPAAVDFPATLTWNLNGKYTALWTKLKVAGGNNVFLKGIDEIELPVAHGEGRIVPRDPSVIEQWKAQGQVVLQYTWREASRRAMAGAVAATAGGAATFGGLSNEVNASNGDPDALLPFPHNPNGSTANIAGLSDPTGRVLGLMPHPERFLFATQHPQWTRRKLSGEGAGMQIFRNAVEYFG